MVGQQHRMVRAQCGGDDLPLFVGRGQARPLGQIDHVFKQRGGVHVAYNQGAFGRSQRRGRRGMGVDNGVHVRATFVDPQMKACGRVGLADAVSTFPFEQAHLIVNQKPRCRGGFIK